MTNAPLPGQLTVGVLRRFLADVDENAIVGFHEDGTFGAFAEVEVKKSHVLLHKRPRVVVVDNPGVGVGFRIERLWAFLAVHDGKHGSTNLDVTDEGVVGASVGGTVMPLVAADQERLGIYMDMARRIAKATGVTIRVARFDTRTDIEVIEP